MLRLPNTLAHAFVTVLAALMSFVWHPAVAADYPYHVDVVQRGQAKDLYVVNDGPAPINVVIELTEATNVGFNPLLIGPKYAHFVKPQSKKFISTAVPFKKDAASSFKYRTYFAFGDSAATPDDDFAYRLPIPDGSRGVLRQFTGLADGALVSQTANAVEIVIDQGTDVVASREGVVIEVTGPGVDDVDLSSTSPIGNHLSILHSDGSFATYGWLKPSSATVKIGDQVRVGQVIAKSWKNPNSTDSYLHFAVLHDYLALDVRSLQPKFIEAGHAQPIVAQSYAGPVSPNLAPRYPVDDPNRPAYLPPEPAHAKPALTDAEYDRLNPRQRADLYRQRVLETTGHADNRVLSREVLVAFAIVACFLVSFGLILAIVSIIATAFPNSLATRVLAVFGLFHGAPMRDVDGPGARSPDSRLIHKTALAPTQTMSDAELFSGIDVEIPQRKRLSIAEMRARDMSSQTVAPSADSRPIDESPDAPSQVVPLAERLRLVCGEAFTLACGVPLGLLVSTGWIPPGVDPDPAQFAVFPTGDSHALCVVESSDRPMNWNAELRSELYSRGLRVVTVSPTQESESLRDAIFAPAIAATTPEPV